MKQEQGDLFEACVDFDLKPLDGYGSEDYTGSWKAMLELMRLAKEGGWSLTSPNVYRLNC